MKKKLKYVGLTNIQDYDFTQTKVFTECLQRAPQP